MSEGLWDLGSASSFRREATLSDLGVCEACQKEVFDPANRRHRYPFTSCRNCGPRHSILRKMPYTRANTTMSEFEMCDECEREYSDPDDRRFGHEAVSCPYCGPAIRALNPSGGVLGSADPLTLASRAIRAQLTIGVKGNGDFHLVCDATSATAVTRMRDRAGVWDTPLTVMVRDLEEASRIARLTERETSLLTSVERPVVLVSIRTDSPLAGEVAAGNQLAGLLLPYTPLHHLLLSETGRPLVFSPAGVQDSTLLARNSALVSELRNVADIFLLHDRPIAARDDDSVARVVDDRVSFEHRSRGLVPAPIKIREHFARPVVGIGFGSNRLVCFATQGMAGLEAFKGGEDPTDEAIDRTLQRASDLFGVDARIVAVDSSERERVAVPASRRPTTVVPVQHHHAHFASCMTENNLRGDVMAVVYDGGAAGEDGTEWGGEILAGNYLSFQRLATFRPLALAGAKAVRRQVWTASIALLDEAFDGEPPLHAMPLFRNIPRRGIEVVRRLRDRSACMSHGAQVYVDAIAAIVMNRPEVYLDGSLSTQFDALADPEESGRYPVVIRDGATPWEIDLRAVARQAALDSMDGVPAATISAKVRNTIASVTTEVLLAHGGVDELPVVLSGDLFERTSLAGPIRERLGRPARVFTHSVIPAGDEGLALGQVMVANAQLQASGSRSTGAAVQQPAD